MWLRLCLILTASLIVRTSAGYDNYFTPTKTGDPKGVLVHLFEWRFDDIAKECEQFLGPKGYAGVQVSPVNEYLVCKNRPWWERYQPVSYKIVSRSGDEGAFRNMVERCNKVGVKIYVDVVLNHMTGTSTSNAKGVGGSTADTINFYYPAVPYTKDDFHTPCSINNYDDPDQVRNCELSGLHDLNQGKSDVRDKMITFLNHLISCGVAGFRVDAAKHMWPADLEKIFGHTSNLNTSQGFDCDAKPFIFQEFAGSGTDGYMKGSEYYPTGHVTDFKYGFEVSRAFRRHNLLKWYSSFNESWGLLESKKALVFIDNHDSQRGDGFGAEEILTHKEPRLYKMAVAFMLAWPHGQPRVMSSYYFNKKDQGPPSNSDESIANVQFSGDICTNGWTCEHRWRQIFNMVKFRNVVKDEKVSNWWDNGNYQAAFSLGNKGFVAFNVESFDLDQRLQTGLPEGRYCDVISGNLESGHCTGKTVSVDRSGYAQIQLKSTEEDGVLAIHKAARSD